MTVRFYSSVAQQETLTGSISAATTAISVSATTGFPASTPFTLALDYGAPNEELVDVTAVAGSLLTVTRAVDGTSATSHNAGAIVRHVSSARDFSDSRNHENSSNAVHGITGAVVGTTDTQTLTNKTLGSGTVFSGSFTLNNPNITGTVTGSATYTNPTLSGAITGSGTTTLTATNPATQPLNIVGAASQTSSLQRWLDSNSTQLANVDSTGKLILNRTGAVSTNNAALVPWTITGAASQTADLLEVKDNGGNNLVFVNGSGALQARAGGTLQGDPSPSTGSIQIKAGPSSSAIVRFLDSTGASQATVGTAGQFVGNDLTILNTASTSAWQGFAPLWTSTGTQPSIGNGTLTGRFYEQGKLVCATWFIQFGTTTTFGTGTWGFSYPPNRQPRQNTPALLTYAGSAVGNRGSWQAGTVTYNKSNDNFRIYSHGGATEWSPTVPATWVANNSDYIQFSVVYEQV